MLVADTGAGAVKAIALDNLSSAPIDIASAANLRTAIFGRKPGNGQGVISSDTMIYLGILHNNGNSGATSPVLSNKLIEVWPKEPAYIWISAPEGGREGAFPQGYVKRIYPSEPEKSTARIRMKYKDNKERYTCARTGDPGKAASYDPNPPDPTKCDKPYRFVNAICDNKDNFSTGTYGVGSFIGTNNFTSCKICGSDTNPCNWEFWITSRYGGDNYKVYFQTADFPSLTYFARATPIYTAVKHIHIERDKMCRNGGLLYDDYGAPGECGGSGQPACCGTGNQLPCNQIRVYDWMKGVGVGNPIKIFDETKPFESSLSEVRTVEAIVDNPDETKVITLDSALTHSYRASSKAGSPAMPIFDNGHSAGFCFNSMDNTYYFIAETSDLSQPFSDAFVTFHVSKDGFEGSNVVPYLPKEWFDSSNDNQFLYFSQIWFKNFIDPGTGSPPRYPVKHNWYHLVGASDCTSSNGFSYKNYDISYVFIKAIENQVEQYCNSNPLPPCSSTKEQEKANHIMSTTSHEIAHQFRVNSCNSLGHCSNNAWCGGTGGSCRSTCGGGSDEWCLMHSAGGFQETVCQRVDGIDKMDCSDLSANPGCPEPDCSGSGHISVRTDEDPE